MIASQLDIRWERRKRIRTEEKNQLKERELATKKSCKCIALSISATPKSRKLWKLKEICLFLKIIQLQNLNSLITFIPFSVNFNHFAVSEIVTCLIMGYCPYTPLRVLHNIWRMDHVSFLNFEFQSSPGLKNFMEGIRDL